MSSSGAAIRVREVGKRFRIAHVEGRPTTLGEAMSRWFRRPFAGRVRGEEFWALKDVSFDVAPGEVVGIIGRNGAGKSTLLKIMSRITSPTEGEIEMEGRVGSLLEVGTGFHPELTGRENIFLNGAILGMKREEIRARFDEIVAFAEIENFLDTPVKRYSSGMYVRLAFAVAAHLNPEILIVDEVLAVGDLSFQKRCLAKMGEVSRSEGRTVLFVSHNMAAISSLTGRVAFLENGRLREIGPTADVVRSYLSSEPGGAEGAWKAEKETSHPLQICSVRLVGPDGRDTSRLEAVDPVVLELEYVVREPAEGVLVELYLMSSDNVHLCTLGEHDAAPSLLLGRSPGRYRSRVELPGGWLGLGQYAVVMNSGTQHGKTFDYGEVLQFEVREDLRQSPRHNRKGLLVPLLPWRTERVPDSVSGR
jgi:lipopolysaccharide transport system ATP-binding protein